VFRTRNGGRSVAPAGAGKEDARAKRNCAPAVLKRTVTDAVYALFAVRQRAGCPRPDTARRNGCSFPRIKSRKNAAQS
jgi:hypothetical protein